MQTSITPVAVYPATANTLVINPISFGPPVGYYYELKGSDGAVLKNGNVSMTEAQWNAWPVDADDDEYQLDAISDNLGLTRA